jgi:hypothetical protein
LALALAKTGWLIQQKPLSVDILIIEKTWDIYYKMQDLLFPLFLASFLGQTI